MGVAGGAGRAAGPVTVYVANEAANTVTPIRAASNTARRPIRVGPGPALIAITPDSRTVYVSCPGTGQVVPVRAGADTAAEPIRISSPGALALAADGRTLYVANLGGDTITPISTATEEPGPPIIVGRSPDAMAVTPDGRTVLVLTSAGITPVDAATNRAGTPVAIQGAHALAVAPDGGTAYVLAMPDSGSQQGFVVPVPVHASAAGTPIKVGLNPVQIVFTPDAKMAYVANYASESVTPIQLPGGQAGPPIAAGKIPTRLAVSPDGTTLYVLDSNIFGGMGPGIPFTMLARMLVSMLFRRQPTWRGQVIPIRVATNSPGKPIKVGRLPIAIAIAS
jgi:DNA-binding beta-propeller fold protein YncE